MLIIKQNSFTYKKDSCPINRTETERRSAAVLYDIKDPDHPDWVHVTAKASLMGAAVFCTHHCRHCKVISPQKLREKVVENLKAGLALYE